MKSLSIVIPAYNEEEAIESFHNGLLMPAVNKLKGVQVKEIIYINDGSRDKTLDKLHKLAGNNKLVKVLSLSRNFGKEPALSAGIDYATGDGIISMDADGQMHPKYMQQFVDKWVNGAEVVIGLRQKYGKHGFIAKTGSKLFYKIIKVMGGSTLPNSTDYCLMDQVVQKEFGKLTEHRRMVRALVNWLGFKQEFVEYGYEDRVAGKPSYNFQKLTALAINSFVSASPWLLYAIGWIGAIVMLLSGMLGLFVIIEMPILGDPMGLNWTGPTMLAIFISFMVGIVLIAQAITALYISHIHTESQNRPLYIVDWKSSKK
jgi:dolichol-phosphate mannosyltransferase